VLETLSRSSSSSSCRGDVETGAVEGDDVLEVELPFPARISLARPRLAG